MFKKDLGNINIKSIFGTLVEAAEIYKQNL